MDNNDKTHFGSRTVSHNEKTTLVNDVFSSVAKHYDIMNDLMSFGVHRLWKKEFVSMVPKTKGSILDLASGSGDIALKIYKNQKLIGNESKLVLSDINPDMLVLAKENFLNNGIVADNISYVIAKGEELPFEDNSFDVVTISFGIRNFTYLEKGIEEIYRVLKPTGRFMCMEFSRPMDPVKFAYDKFSDIVIPKIGKYVAKNEEAYQYLVESIRKFPSQEEFKSMIQNAGFSSVNYKNLSFGIVAIHTGHKV
ncbi:MAG: bifunctional demethylmenaquinone methyltransferase/2-methoxy-6-polyprenyl-1,4-benzoquinol methylase UbiE [Alphaproteobacteria bacterium]|nr:bifunctional demethylmenaquinone methyltransferase/2-methoxy-6-polyprenyl-1,4-benzoquinol methylase UbiE [Alphaproteobacteria bacterium]OJV14164.1 MAG: bifunctional demethylmenaquinone methyltransferase/2-methoxy-6-polyprenyl-1,4-benzoquinol methylase [Alphaproteobacteria bacterium 33-17]